MKNLKISLATLVFAIILTISTGVFAANDLDLDNKITMPSTSSHVLSEGKGTVSTSLSGSMKYQFVEISKAQYNLIIKYEDMMTVVRAYINHDNYDNAASVYQSKYNENASAIKDGMTINGETVSYSFDEEGYRAIRSAWTHAMGAYNASAWVESTDKTISVDTTTFDGTKYYAAFVQIGGETDAEVYAVTGHKVEEPKQEDNNTPEDNTPADNTPNNNTKKNATQIKTGKTDGSSTSSTLPHTGAGTTIFGLIALASTAAGASYVKYRKIK